MKILIILAAILITALLIPVRAYAQIAHNNVSVPSEPSKATTTSLAPFLFSLNRTEPIPINYEKVCQEIAYPSEAVEAGIEGNVHVRVLVSNEGTYIGHQVLYAASPILRGAVDVHAQKLSFTPATENGVATTGWVSVPFFFKLED